VVTLDVFAGGEIFYVGDGVGGHIGESILKVGDLAAVAKIKITHGVFAVKIDSNFAVIGAFVRVDKVVGSIADSEGYRGHRCNDENNDADEDVSAFVSGNGDPSIFEYIHRFSCLV